MLPNIYSYHGIRPVIHPSAYIHPQATIIGQVEIGQNVYIGPHAVLRGDWGRIIIKNGANVQENCTLHVFPGIATILEEDAHIGHGAVIHSATIGRNSLVGMNAVVMDKAVIAEECIIGALCFVPTEFTCPPRSLIVGSPAKIIREISDEMIMWKTKGTEVYKQLAREAHTAIQACDPLLEPTEQPAPPISDYSIWTENK